MRILLITPYLPSPIRTRSYNFIKGLVKRKHRIHVVSLVESKQEEKQLMEMQSVLIKTSPVLLPKIYSIAQTTLLWFLPQPLQCTYTMSMAMKRLIREIIRKENFNCIHIEHLRAEQFLPDIPNLPPVIFDAVDHLTSLYRQFILHPTSRHRHFVNLIEYYKLRKHELRILNKFRTIITSTPQEAKLVSAQIRRSQIIPITNGVDLNYFQPIVSPRTEYDIIFSGKMSYFANEQAVLYLCKEIMPLVWQSLPRTRLLIAGNGPTLIVRRLDDGYRVKVTGYVKEMPDVFSQVQIAVCPIISGAGIQNKVLEAMAMAKPVVATGLAINGLRLAKAREHLLLADNPRNFAQSIIFLLRHPDTARRIGIAARRYVEIHHRWQDKVEQLETVYKKVYKEVGKTSNYIG